MHIVSFIKQGQVTGEQFDKVRKRRSQQYEYDRTEVRDLKRYSVNVNVCFSSYPQQNVTDITINNNSNNQNTADQSRRDNDTSDGHIYESLEEYNDPTFICREDRVTRNDSYSQENTGNQRQLSRPKSSLDLARSIRDNPEKVVPNFESDMLVQLGDGRFHVKP